MKARQSGSFKLISRTFLNILCIRNTELHECIVNVFFFYMSKSKYVSVHMNWSGKNADYFYEIPIINRK